MKVQVALDFTKLSEALKIAEQVYEFVDILEVGTPLLKAEGLNAIREMKKFGVEVFADTKTADVARIEGEMVRDAGADYFSVLAVAPEETVKEALEVDGIKKSVDLIGVKNKVEKAKEFEGKFDVIEIHTGIDEGIFDPEKYKELKGLKGLSVAGGITVDNIPKIKEILEPETVIIGRGITKAENPREMAKKIREVLECL